MKSRRFCILIAGQLGSGCTEVAEVVSRDLSLENINTEKVLKRIVAEEKWFEFAEKATSGEVDVESIIRSEVIDLARLGGYVIEGKSAFRVLDLKADLKVLLIAPLEARVQHVSKRRGISLEAALDDVRVSDEDREALVKQLFKRNWLDVELYDLVINTYKWKFEDVAKIVEEALRRRLT